MTSLAVVQTSELLLRSKKGVSLYFKKQASLAAVMSYRISIITMYVSLSAILVHVLRFHLYIMCSDCYKQSSCGSYIKVLSMRLRAHAYPQRAKKNTAGCRDNWS